MNEESIFRVIVEHTCNVIPSLKSHSFQTTDSLRELGANSIDRSEIIMMTLDSLSANIPMIEFSNAGDMGEIARVIYEQT